ncbi:MAG: TetR family transcriptional regulator [Robiginitomaculum sp.]
MPEENKTNKRDQILNDAISQFNNQGYHDTRLEDIARIRGTGATNISYHFKSKEALLEEAYGLACNFSDAEIIVAARARNGLERAIAFIRAHAQTHANALTGMSSPLSLLNDFTAFSKPEFTLISARFNKHIEGFKLFLNDGLEDGSVDVSSVNASTFFVFNVLHWLPRWIAAVPQPDRDKAIDDLCDLLRNGLAQDVQREADKPITRTELDEYPAIFDRETRNRLKRDAFLRVGTRHLNKKGYRNLSLDEITKELGVTRGAFYYHIADKETLFISCFERTCNLIEESQYLAANNGATDRVSELEQAMRWIFEGHITNLDPLLKYNLIHALDPAPRALIQARLRRLRASYAEILANGMMEGSVRTIDLDTAEHIFFGAIFTSSGRRFASTQFYQEWQPNTTPIAVSAAYFEPLFTGLSSH